MQSLPKQTMVPRDSWRCSIYCRSVLRNFQYTSITQHPLRSRLTPSTFMTRKHEVSTSTLVYRWCFIILGIQKCCGRDVQVVGGHFVDAKTIEALQTVSFACSLIVFQLSRYSHLQSTNTLSHPYLLSPSALPLSHSIPPPPRLHIP